MYIVQINSEDKNMGCFQKSFEKLGDDVRDFIKSSAADFRKNASFEIKCVATILKSGMTLSDAKIIEC